MLLFLPSPRAFLRLFSFARPLSVGALQQRGGVSPGTRPLVHFSGPVCRDKALSIARDRFAHSFIRGLVRPLPGWAGLPCAAFAGSEPRAPAACAGARAPALGWVSMPGPAASPLTRVSSDSETSHVLPGHRLPGSRAPGVAVRPLFPACPSLCVAFSPMSPV